MIRIKDDKPVEIPDDDQLARVEKRLTGVKSNVEERLENLGKQLTARTMALEGILTDHIHGLENKGELKSQFQVVEGKLEGHFQAMEEKFEQRLDSLEARFTSLEQVLREFIQSASGNS